MKKYILLLFLLCHYSYVHAQESSATEKIISTERPSQGANSATVLPKGYVQIEAGISFSQTVHHSYWNYYYLPPGNIPVPVYSNHDDKIFKYYHLPEFLFKYGLTNRLELRTKTSLLHSDLELPENSLPVSPDTYLRNWTLGLKYQILEYQQSRGHLSFMAEGEIPNTRSGKHLVESNWGIHFHALNSYFLSDRFELRSNLGYSFGELSEISMERRANWALLANLSLMKKLFFVSEWYGRAPINPHPYHSNKKLFHALNGGFLYQLSHTLQLDVGGGVGLTEDIYEYQYHLSAGLAWHTKLF